MLRAVVLILVALQVLMPPGVCVRKFGVTGWLTRSTTAQSQATNNPAKTAEKRQKGNCCSGCRERASQVGETPASTEPPLRVSCDGPAIQDGSQPDPCCKVFCKVQFDKIVQPDNPQVDGEAVPHMLSSITPFHDQVPPPPHPAPAAAVPLYVTFCTFTI